MIISELSSNMACIALLLNQNNINLLVLWYLCTYICKAVYYVSLYFNFYWSILFSFVIIFSYYVFIFLKSLSKWHSILYFFYSLFLASYLSNILALSSRNNFSLKSNSMYLNFFIFSLPIIHVESLYLKPVEFEFKIYPNPYLGC